MRRRASPRGRCPRSTVTPPLRSRDAPLSLTAPLACSASSRSFAACSLLERCRARWPAGSALSWTTMKTQARPSVELGRFRSASAFLPAAGYRPTTSRFQESWRLRRNRESASPSNCSMPSASAAASAFQARHFRPPAFSTTTAFGCGGSSRKHDQPVGGNLLPKPYRVGFSCAPR